MNHALIIILLGRRLAVKENKSRVIPCFLLPVLFSELLSAASGLQFQRLIALSVPHIVVFGLYIVLSLLRIA